MKRLNRKNLIALVTASAVAFGGYCAPVQAQEPSSPASAEATQSSSDKSSDDNDKPSTTKTTDPDSPDDGLSSGSSGDDGKLDSDKITDWIKVVSVVVTLLTSVATLIGKFNNFKF